MNILFAEIYLIIMFVLNLLGLPIAAYEYAKAQAKKPTLTSVIFAIVHILAIIAIFNT